MKLQMSAISVAALVAAGVVSMATPASAALTINPIFATSFDLQGSGLNPADIVNLNTDAAAMSAITAATSQVASQFGNNVTSNIVFFGYHGGTNGFLGASVSGQSVYSYSQYTSALAADALANPQNTTLNTAVANIGLGNGAVGSNIVVNTTDARVLGLGTGINTNFGPGDATAQFSATGGFVGSDAGGVADGVVFLNIDQPLFYTRPIPSANVQQGYDAQSTMEHEVDEVMGIGGAGSQLNDFNDDANYAHDFYGVSGPLMGVLDLYRYQAPGVASFDPHTTSITGCTPNETINGVHCSGLNSPYFSVDGGLTSIDEFNQAFPAIGGDAADWGLDLFQNCAGNNFVGGSGDVQDAFNCNNRSADVKPGTPAYQAFEAIGYNAIAVGTPEPAAWALMILGFGLAGASLRRWGAPAARDWAA